MSLIAMKHPFLLQVMYDDDPLNPRTEYDNFGHLVCWHCQYNLGDEHNFSEPSQWLLKLVSDTVTDDAVIDYVKSGKAERTKIKHEGNHWTVSYYDDYFKKWYEDFMFEGTFEEQKSLIAQGVRESLPDRELMELAKEENVIFPLSFYNQIGLHISVDSFRCRGSHDQWDSAQAGWIYATADDIRREYGSCSAENMEKAKELLKSEVKVYDYYLSGQCYGFRLFENGEETDSCWGFLGEFQDVLKEIASQALPESHWDMVEHLYEVSDTVTRPKEYEDFMEDLEELRAVI